MALVKKESDVNQVIVGWKAIAEALGVKQSTAIRWARKYNLPVWRLDMGHHSAVRARRSDLMAWLRRHEVQVYARK